MSKSISNATKLSQVFIDYCKKKKYQVKHSKVDNSDWRLEISNIRERTIVTIYHTGSIVVAGPNNSLKEEFRSLKQEIEGRWEKPIYLIGDAYSPRSIREAMEEGTRAAEEISQMS